MCRMIWQPTVVIAFPQVVEAKGGAGSATLSMAYAAARFAESCLRAQLGESGVTEYAFVEARGPTPACSVCPP